MAFPSIKELNQPVAFWLDESIDELTEYMFEETLFEEQVEFNLNTVLALNHLHRLRGTLVADHTESEQWKSTIECMHAILILNNDGFLIGQKAMNALLQSLETVVVKMVDYFATHTTVEAALPKDYFYMPEVRSKESLDKMASDCLATARNVLTHIRHRQQHGGKGLMGSVLWFMFRMAEMQDVSVWMEETCKMLASQESPRSVAAVSRLPKVQSPPRVETRSSKRLKIQRESMMEHNHAQATMCM